MPISEIKNTQIKVCLRYAVDHAIYMFVMSNEAIKCGLELYIIQYNPGPGLNNYVI